MTVSLVSYGGGTDSTALLIEMVNRGEAPPYAILFANPGGERPYTYWYVFMFSAWLERHGYPSVTMVQAVNRKGEPNTLEATSLRTKRLPSVAFGFKTCSQRFKSEPQEKWANRDPICMAEWAAGRVITKIIGYNFDEAWRAKLWSDGKTTNRYPLMEWEIGKSAAVDIIDAAGLPRPGKSACFFCPHMKLPEIIALRRDHPDLFERALAIESNAEWKSPKIKGLGRRFAWSDFVAGLPIAEPDPAASDIPCGCYDG